MISESQNNDFSAGGNLVIISPGDWQFDPTSTPSATILSSPTDLSVSLLSVSSIAVNYTITVNGTSNEDQLVLHGIKIQAKDCNSVDSLGASVTSFPINGLTVDGLSIGTTVGYVSVNPNSPLPVELASFSAILKDKEVILNWSTATEVNNYGFDIERMMDGEDWNALGFVEGNGNSNSPKDYNFVDNTVSNAGTYYYRLKQIDNDGTYEYSKSISVDFDAPAKFDLEQNYPNPFNPSTTIRFNLPDNEFVSLKIFNTLGEEVQTLFEGNLNAGTHTYNFNAEGLPSGLYIYRLLTNAYSKTKKMLFMK